MITFRVKVPFVGALLALLATCGVLTGDGGDSGGSRKSTDGPGFAEEADILETPWSSRGFQSAQARKPAGEALNSGEAVAVAYETGPAVSAYSAVSAVRHLVDNSVLGEDAPAPWLGMRPGVDLDVDAGVQPVWFGEVQQFEWRSGFATLTGTQESLQPLVQVSAEQSAEGSSVGGEALLQDPFPRITQLTLAEASAEDATSSVSNRSALYAQGLASGAAGWLGPRIDGSLMTVPQHRRSARNLYPLHHQPLYFEQANLERCGKSYGCLTSAASYVHFTASAAMLPWQMAVAPPCSRVRSLGDCPTGCEYRCSDLWPECSLKGIAAEAGVITALIFIFP